MAKGGGRQKGKPRKIEIPITSQSGVTKTHIDEAESYFVAESRGPKQAKLNVSGVPI